VVWKDEAGTAIPLPFDEFQPNTVYQAEITLTAKSGYGFYSSTLFTYPEGKIKSQYDDLGEPRRIITVIFNNSDDADITFVTDYNLQNYVPVPLAGEQPVQSVPFRGDVTVTAAWNEKDVPGPFTGSFVAGTAYQANIRIEAQPGYRFRAEKDFAYPEGTVSVQPGSDSNLQTRDLEVTYKETRMPIVISDLNLTSYIPKPISGTMPVSFFAAPQYTGTVIWKNAQSQVVLTGPFQAGVEYTAEVTLIPAMGYSFAGVEQNGFTHTGAKTVTNSAGSGPVSIGFSATPSMGGSTVVYDFDLTGRIPRPISGETPVLTVGGTQYTGVVTWVPQPHSDFQYDTVYTAVVALNAAPGYTFTGIGQNVFTHEDAPNVPSNLAGSGTIIIVFPPTASSTYGVITSFGPAAAEGSALELLNEKKSDNVLTIDLPGSFTEVVIPNSAVLTAGINSPAKVVINGHGRVLTIQAEGTLLTVGGGVTLTLRDITLTGTSGNNAPLVTVQHGGKLILGAGTTLSENQSDGDVGGVWVDGGELVLNNGVIIKGMEAQRGGGVLVDTGGEFVMNGGTIGGVSGDGNRVLAVNGGGGVLVADGSFTMLGGTIQSNQADAAQSGGGVLVAGGSFDMLGGTIQSNQATAARSGGGAAVMPGGTFTMYDGTIKRNEALCPPGPDAESGGGVLLMGVSTGSVVGTFTMYGGTIGGGNPAADANTAITGANGLYVMDGKFAMSGGNIQGNTGNSNNGVAYLLSSPGGYNNQSTFTMTGAAMIDANDTVFLYANSTITIGGNLDASTAANIITNTPVKGTTRLVRANSVIPTLFTTNYTKFLYNGAPGHINSTPVSDYYPGDSLTYNYGLYDE
jgi:hypothetical protein